MAQLGLLVRLLRPRFCVIATLAHKCIEQSLMTALIRTGSRLGPCDRKHLRSGHEALIRIVGEGVKVLSESRMREICMSGSKCRPTDPNQLSPEQSEMGAVDYPALNRRDSGVAPRMRDPALSGDSCR